MQRRYLQSKWNAVVQAAKTDIYKSVAYNVSIIVMVTLYQVNGNLDRIKTFLHTYEKKNSLP